MLMRKGYALKEWQKLFGDRHLSLDYVYEDKDGDKVKLEDFVGSEDSGYDDVEVRLLISELAQDEEERRILYMLLDGASQAECARELGKSRAWVSYKVSKIKERAERLLAGKGKSCEGLKGGSGC